MADASFDPEVQTSWKGMVLRGLPCNHGSQAPLLLLARHLRRCAGRLEQVDSGLVAPSLPGSFAT